MKTENNILVGGLTLAAVVCAAGFWNERRLDKRLELFVAECEAGNAGRTPTTPPPPLGYKLDNPKRPTTAKPITAEEVLSGVRSPEERNPFEQFDDVCDAGELYRTPNPIGLQGKIADAYSDSMHATSLTSPVATAIGVLSVIPWLWYFLLRRIVELREAIGGKTP